MRAGRCPGLWGFEWGSVQSDPTSTSTSTNQGQRQNSHTPSTRPTPTLIPMNPEKTDSPECESITTRGHVPRTPFQNQKTPHMRHPNPNKNTLQFPHKNPKQKKKIKLKKLDKNNKNQTFDLFLLINFSISPSNPSPILLS